MTYFQIGNDRIDAATVTGPLPSRRFREAWKLDGTSIILDEAHLPAIKARLKAEVDAEAESERRKHITPGFGQVLTYQQKLAEAQAVIAGERDPARVPVLAASVGIEAETLSECAALVVSRWNAWRAIANDIEAVRLGAKAAVDAASTIEDAASARDAAVWP